MNRLNTMTAAIFAMAFIASGCAENTEGWNDPSASTQWEEAQLQSSEDALSVSARRAGNQQAAGREEVGSSGSQTIDCGTETVIFENETAGTLTAMVTVTDNCPGPGAHHETTIGYSSDAGMTYIGVDDGGTKTVAIPVGPGEFIGVDCSGAAQEEGQCCTYSLTASRGGSLEDSGSASSGNVRRRAGR